MQKAFLSFVFIALATTFVNGQTRVKKTSDDFIPGAITLFEDSLKGEQLGEFPSRWDLEHGLVEVMGMGDVNVIGVVQSNSRITPLIDREAYLPDHFTLEFDIYFHNQGNEGYYVNFDNRKMNVRFGNARVKYGGTLNRSAKKQPREGWQHVSISFNERAFKAYLDGERFVNVPNIETPPNRFSISALSHNTSADKYAIITNVRLAEGGMPLYERLVEAGRFVTNDIQFDTNKYYHSNNTKQMASKLNDYIEIGVFGKNEEIILLQQLHICTQENEFQLELNARPVKIGIDPFQKLIDSTPSNNWLKIN
ncbi:MAG: hypothetical protein AAFU03_13430 [Bacteroidota bacterium]